MAFTQRILTFGLLFGVVYGQEPKSCRMVKAIQHPKELNLDVGKTLKDLKNKSWRPDDRVHPDNLNNGGKQRNQSPSPSPSPDFPHVAQPTSSQRDQTPSRVHTNVIVTNEKSGENVGISAVQSPIELGFELGRRRKDPGGLPITNLLESNFLKETSITLPSVGITKTEDKIPVSNPEVLPSDYSGTHRPTTLSATTLTTDLLLPDRANTWTTDASSGSNAWVLPSVTTDRSRGWAPPTQAPGSGSSDIWGTQSTGAADSMGLMNMFGNPLMMFLMSGDMPDAPNLGAAGTDPLTGGMTDPLLGQLMLAQMVRQLRNARPTSQTGRRNMPPDWRRPRSGSEFEANTGPDPMFKPAGATTYDHGIRGRLHSRDNQDPMSNSIARGRQVHLGFTPPPGADPMEGAVGQTQQTRDASSGSGRRLGDIPPPDAMGSGDMGGRPIEMPATGAMRLMDMSRRPGDMPPPDVMGSTDTAPMMDRMTSGARRAMIQTRMRERMGSMRPPVDTLAIIRRLRELQRTSMSPAASESGALADRASDLADMRADRMDNLQALGPMGMLLGSGGFGGGGLGGIGGLDGLGGMGGLGGLSGMAGLGGLGADSPGGLASMLRMIGGAGGSLSSMMALLGAT